MPGRGCEKAAGIAARQAEIFLGLWEILQSTLRSKGDVPRHIHGLLKDRRFGSRDRKLYRALLFTALRYKPWIDGIPAARRTAATAWLSEEEHLLRWVEHDPAGFPRPGDSPSLVDKAHVLAECFPTQDFSVSALSPDWFEEEFLPTDSLAWEREILQRRAPLWIRVRAGAPPGWKEDIEALGTSVSPAGVLPGAWRVQASVDAAQTEAYLRGEFEVQDLGSQLLLSAVALLPGSRWLDACAGAGGKTLQLSEAVGPTGVVDAHDVRTSALEELRRRCQRAGLANVRVLREPPPSDARYDGVLLDAPCSGSGTWRRAPHLKWQVSREQLVRAAQQQGELLRRYARHVAPGGSLVYATCSLARAENEAVIERFLADSGDFEAARARPFSAGHPSGAGWRILPSHHDTDGFFVAVLRRR